MRPSPAFLPVFPCIWITPTQLSPTGPTTRSRLLVTRFLLISPMGRCNTQANLISPRHATNQGVRKGEKKKKIFESVTQQQPAERGSTVLTGRNGGRRRNRFCQLWIKASRAHCENTCIHYVGKCTHSYCSGETLLAYGCPSTFMKTSKHVYGSLPLTTGGKKILGCFN